MNTPCNLVLLNRFPETKKKKAPRGGNILSPIITISTQGKHFAAKSGQLGLDFLVFSDFSLAKVEEFLSQCWNIF
jgi:hypothetical protein